MPVEQMVEHRVVEEEGKAFQKARQAFDEERARAMAREFDSQKEVLLKPGTSGRGTTKTPAARATKPADTQRREAA